MEEITKTKDYLCRIEVFHRHRNEVRSVPPFQGILLLLEGSAAELTSNTFC